MCVVNPPILRDYAAASSIEWIETDGVGGISASSIIGANTRKQHAVLSVNDEKGRRTVIVANLQESVTIMGRTYDLSTNAFFGAVNPRAYERLELFTTDPWPTWQFRCESLVIEKQLVMVHGEHTVVARYKIVEGELPATLTVRPLLAFRDQNAIRFEQATFLNNWQVTSEFIECQPAQGDHVLYIAHPNARVETIGLWYRGFLYERDRESRLDCIEDLYQPGYLDLTLLPGQPRSLIFSSPSPRAVGLVDAYLDEESKRRTNVICSGQTHADLLFQIFLRSADTFVYENFEGILSIVPGLPWGECEVYRGLMAFPGLLLVPQRFQTARDYLSGIDATWRNAPQPSQFSSENAVGQMHPADVPLWVFVAAWRYWKATGDESFTSEVLVPLLQEMAKSYIEGDEVRQTDAGLIEVGHERGANYAPVLPLGTNVLWFNALMILAELTDLRREPESEIWRGRAQQTGHQLLALFTSDNRAGLADAVHLDSVWKDDSIRLSQVLAAGLPYCVLENPGPTVELIVRHLLTPLGPRTLSPTDTRYVGDGTDVSRLPKVWSGSVDPGWFGYACDALKRTGSHIERELFAPFETRMYQRGFGHISGAYAGNAPHDACDYVASASAVGEVMRIYAREILAMPHVA